MSLKLAPSDYEIYIPIGEWIEGNIKEWLFEQRPLFKKISAPIDTVLNSLDSLFNFDSIKSPNVPKTLIIIAIISQFGVVNVSSIYLETIDAEIQQNKRPPKNPSTVL